MVNKKKLEAMERKKAKELQKKFQEKNSYTPKAASYSFSEDYENRISQIQQRKAKHEENFQKRLHSVDSKFEQSYKRYEETNHSKVYNAKLATQNVEKVFNKNKELSQKKEKEIVDKILEKSKIYESRRDKRAQMMKEASERTKELNQRKMQKAFENIKRLKKENFKKFKAKADELQKKDRAFSAQIKQDTHESLKRKTLNSLKKHDQRENYKRQYLLNLRHKEKVLQKHGYISTDTSIFELVKDSKLSPKNSN